MKTIYEGFYARFDTPSKKEGAILTGADTLVGDELELTFRFDQDNSKAWLVNKFGHDIGFFDPATTRKLQIIKARDWDICPVLSFAAYSDTPKPGIFWGEVALICFDRRYSKKFQPFVKSVSEKSSQGLRSDLNISQSSAYEIAEGNKEANVIKTIPFPKLDQGTVFLKSRQSLLDKTIEEGRKGNKGCYVFSWTFILIIVFLVAYFIYQAL